jgi:hypothetical protein
VRKDNAKTQLQKAIPETSAPRTAQALPALKMFCHEEKNIFFVTLTKNILHKADLGFVGAVLGFLEFRHFTGILLAEHLRERVDCFSGTIWSREQKYKPSWQHTVDCCVLYELWMARKKGSRLAFVRKAQ